MCDGLILICAISDVFFNFNIHYQFLIFIGSLLYILSFNIANIQLSTISLLLPYALINLRGVYNYL